MRFPAAFALALCLGGAGGASVAVAGPGDASPKAPVDPKTPAEKVDLNAATVDQLVALPGVGDAIARKIVAGRPYASVDDLAAAGVGPGTIDKIRGLVTVSRTHRGAEPKEPAAAGPHVRGSERLDLNRATEDELMDLPGVGKVTAERIVTGRPYASVDDLAKAGVSAKTIEKIRGLVVATAPRAAKPRPRAPDAPDPTGPIDLNTASLDRLIELPGVGEVTARKIVAGRPFASFEDLASAGVGPATIAKIKGAGAVVGRPGAAKRAARVELNTASEDELIALPGVGEVTARKIVAGRPYRSIDDLEAAGLSERLIEKIEPLVTVDGRPLPPQPRVDRVAGGGDGKVWVNLRSGIYHTETDRWYGRTKEGRYMTVAEARAVGFRAAGDVEKDDDASGG